MWVWVSGLWEDCRREGIRDTRVGITANEMAVHVSCPVSCEVRQMLKRPCRRSGSMAEIRPAWLDWRIIDPEAMPYTKHACGDRVQGSCARGMRADQKQGRGRVRQGQGQDRGQGQGQGQGKCQLASPNQYHAGIFKMHGIQLHHCAVSHTFANPIAPPPRPHEWLHVARA